MLNITPYFYIIVSEADSRAYDSLNPFITHSYQIAERSAAQRRGIHYPNLNRDAIISVVNTVTELGKPALFPILPELLAVHVNLLADNLKRTDPSFDSPRAGTSS